MKNELTIETWQDNIECPININLSSISDAHNLNVLVPVLRGSVVQGHGDLGILLVLGRYRYPHLD